MVKSWPVAWEYRKKTQATTSDNLQMSPNLHIGHSMSDWFYAHTTKKLNKKSSDNFLSTICFSSD